MGQHQHRKQQAHQRHGAQALPFGGGKAAVRRSGPRRRPSAWQRQALASARSQTVEGSPRPAARSGCHPEAWRVARKLSTGDLGVQGDRRIAAKPLGCSLRAVGACQSRHKPRPPCLLMPFDLCPQCPCRQGSPPPPAFLYSQPVPCWIYNVGFTAAYVQQAAAPAAATRTVGRVRSATPRPAAAATPPCVCGPGRL